MQTFTAEDAKQQFGELIEQALQEPVSITRHGRPSVVVTSDAEYRELSAGGTTWNVAASLWPMSWRIA